MTLRKKQRKECEEACEEKVKNAEGQQDEAKDSDGAFSGAEKESSDRIKKAISLRKIRKKRR